MKYILIPLLLFFLSQDVNQTLHDLSLAEDSTMHILIYIDLPDCSDQLFLKTKNDFDTGHVSIGLREETINERKEMIFGFHPKDKTELNFLRLKTQSEIRNDEGREFDLVYKNLISGAELDKIKNAITQLKEKEFSLNKFNCVDFTLEILKSIHIEVNVPKQKYILRRFSSPRNLALELDKLTTSNTQFIKTFDRCNTHVNVVD